MSHNVTISNVKIANLDALKMAIKELSEEGIKISLRESHGTFRTYQGQKNTADMAILLPEAQHDIGLVKQPDGTYLPVYDPYLSGGNGLACSLDPKVRDERYGIAKLTQRYTVCVTELEAALQGHACIRQPGENGEINVLVEVN